MGQATITEPNESKPTNAKITIRIEYIWSTKGYELGRKSQSPWYTKYSNNRKAPTKVTSNSFIPTLLWHKRWVGVQSPHFHWSRYPLLRFAYPLRLRQSPTLMFGIRSGAVRAGAASEVGARQAGVDPDIGAILSTDGFLLDRLSWIQHRLRRRMCMASKFFH